MTPAPVDPFALIGTLLEGQYRVDAVVGEGGFGVVYKGWHLTFEQPVAIKALKVPHAVDLATQNSVLSKFREEARLYYMLSQASLSIVRSIGFGALNTPSGVWAPFVVLEWLEGKSLATDLAERHARGMRGRSLADAMTLLEPAARGLAYAHGKRVAHRDVKPGNFFLTTLGDPPKPTVKVLDFGIAKVMAEGSTAASAPATNTGFTSFTPHYAAPEQFDPRFGPTGPWTDVFAFALVVIEVMTDNPPSDDEAAIAVIARVTDVTKRPTPRSRGLAVSDAVEAVFARALAVDPKARFVEAGAFWDALVQAARATPAPPPNDLSRTTPLHGAPSPTQRGTAKMPSVHPARIGTAPMPSQPMPSQPLPSQAAPSQGARPSQAGGAASRPAPTIAVPSYDGRLPTPAPMSAPAAWAPSAPAPPTSTPWAPQGPPGVWPQDPRGSYIPAPPPPPASHSGTTWLAVIIGVVLTLGFAALIWFRG